MYDCHLCQAEMRKDTSHHLCTNIHEGQLALADAIDIVKDHGTDGAAPTSSGHASASAFMMDGNDPDAPSGRQRLYHANLETVDPTTDQRVFALLDEGCNMSCHGKGWIEHALRAFKRAGPHKPVSELDTTNVKSYKGIGTSKSLGSRTIPWGLLYKKVASDGTVCAQGTIRSNEMSGDNPLLLSLHAQSTLGFIKDVQAGTCYMKHMTGSGPEDF